MWYATLSFAERTWQIHFSKYSMCLSEVEVQQTKTLAFLMNCRALAVCFLFILMLTCFRGWWFSVHCWSQWWNIMKQSCWLPSFPGHTKAGVDSVFINLHRILNFCCSPFPDMYTSLSSTDFHETKTVFWNQSFSDDLFKSLCSSTTLIWDIWRANKH